MNTTNEQFERFRKSFLAYAKEWGLNDWKFFFDHKLLHGHFAEIHCNVSACSATILFTTEVSEEGGKFIDPERTGKHEACHLLCSRITSMAERRFISQEEIDDESERLTRHLTNILPDIHDD